MKKINFILITATALSITGCASLFNPVGDNKFDCNRKQDPNSPYCRSFKAVEKGTEGPVPASRFDREFDLTEQDKLNKIAPDKTSDKSIKTDPQQTRIVSLPHLKNDADHDPSIENSAVRQAPIIQKIYINRWVDENDSLHEDTVVSREVIPTRWAGFPAIGVGAQSNTKLIGNYPHVDEDAFVDKSSQQVIKSPTKGTVNIQSSSDSDYKQPGVISSPITLPENTQITTQPASKTMPE